MSSEEALDYLTSSDSDIAKEFHNFRSKHGHRGYKEGDLGTKTWEIDPSSLISTLQANVRAGDFNEPNREYLTVADLQPQPSLMQRYS